LFKSKPKFKSEVQFLSNRKIVLTLKERNNGKYVNIRAIDIEGGSSRVIYLEEYEKPLKLIKQVVKNGDDDESTYLYLITNDIDFSCSHRLRWEHIYKLNCTSLSNTKRYL